MSKQIATNDENARSNIIQTPTTSFKDQNEIIQGVSYILCSELQYYNPFSSQVYIISSAYRVPTSIVF